MSKTFFADSRQDFPLQLQNSFKGQAMELWDNFTLRWFFASTCLTCPSYLYDPVKTRLPNFFGHMSFTNNIRLNKGQNYNYSPNLSQSKAFSDSAASPGNYLPGTPRLIIQSCHIVYSFYPGSRLVHSYEPSFHYYSTRGKAHSWEKNCTNQ